MKRKRDFICVQQQLIKTKDFYMGRTLDYEFSYGEKIAIMPRNYPFTISDMDRENIEHYAMIGMASCIR